jgi:hypothetical protein
MADFIPLTIGQDTAVIHLTRGRHALVDSTDWPGLTSFGKWHAHRAFTGRELYYAANKRQSSGRTFMHNLLIEVPAGMVPDHKNGNRLDNRRGNLRPATRSQNRTNCRQPNRTGFRGVRRQTNGTYQAMIGSKGRHVGLGTYKTAEEAARAYDRAAKERFGEFAALNFPE